MRIVNWNIARHPPHSWQSKSLIEEIGSLSPNLICLTEAWQNSLDRFGGYTISSRGVPWSLQDTEERRVLLWSPSPWTEIDNVDDLEAVGSAVVARTKLAGKDVRIVGLCIPYPFASPFGQTPKAPQWRMHEQFVELLKPRLQKWTAEGPTIIVGDFNRRIPRAWGSKRAYEKLIEALGGLALPTAGLVHGLEEQIIDHIAFTGHFSANSVFGRSAVLEDGRERSDHHGVIVDFDYA